MNGRDDLAKTPDLPIRRRRSFLAAKRNDDLEADTIPVKTEDEDIPLLTEVVPQEVLSTPVEKPEPELTPSIDARIEELAAQMTRSIGEQMAYELPTLIEATLLNAGEELRAGITATMETALREFIARRKQLNLPLDPSQDEVIDRG